VTAETVLTITFLFSHVLGFAPSTINDRKLSQSISYMSEMDTIDDLHQTFNRRDAIRCLFTAGSTIAGTLVATAQSSGALDMDAFMNSELAKDTENCDPKKDSKCIPKLSKEEALCKYGQGGKARGEACKSLKDSGKEVPKVSQGKSLGGAYAM